MSSEERCEIRLADYRPSDFLIDSVELEFELGEVETLVHSRIVFARRDGVASDVPLVLDGCELELRSLRIDNQLLKETDYSVDPRSLTVPQVGDRFVFEATVAIHPEANTSLEGLYKSSGNFCTQCEAEGFRKITYFLDRPDVMTRFTTTVRADAALYPVLLSNGNPAGAGRTDDGRAWAKWEDPFPKPSYLFALVAGDLVCVEDRFETCSGRQVDLRIYVEPRNGDRCEHAMRSLVKAMRWDEEVYGREYDLDVYMIVAVDDFNMGAMENKGLNVFNSKYVLARPETATDDDYAHIEGVIAHEYFHNWSGNRVTCRDWFQLSLKEGFTVFRDQEFSADMTSRPVKRIADVQVLRNHQFPEDGGPMAHPVRPESYIEINNFYTATVYNKGAEVVRMIHALVGAEGFRRGSDLYFERHDGQAVTTEHFVCAMEDANEVDLGQFRLWYSQAGTPELRIGRHYDAQTGVFELTIEQVLPPTPNQVDKEPMHIPVVVGLVGPDGSDMPVRLDGESSTEKSGSSVLQLRESRQVFRFVDVDAEPVPSLVRGFSAPVKLDFDLTDEELGFLAAHDSDPFNRWDAGQRYAMGVILRMVEQRREGAPVTVPAALIEAFRSTLAARELDPALRAKALVLPAEVYLGEQMDVVDVEGLHEARERVRSEVADELREQLLSTYERSGSTEPYSIDPVSMGRRSLRNLSLAYLMRLQGSQAVDLCVAQIHDSDNMTDCIAALGILADAAVPERAVELDRFYDRWRHDPLVLDKWFSIQAMSSLEGTLERVTALLDHEAFEITNPNKVRALIGAFCAANPIRFHAASGAGYSFLADQVLRIDPINSQIAARLVAGLSRWKRYDSSRAELMKSQLERIVASDQLSRDVYEIASKSLGK